MNAIDRASPDESPFSCERTLRSRHRHALRFRDVALLLVALLAGAAVTAWSRDARAATGCDTLHTKPARYQGFALGSGSADQSWGSLFWSLRPYDRNRWRLLHWSPELSRCVEAGSGLDSLELGTGYWLITRDSQQVVTCGTRVSDDTVNVPLHRQSQSAPAWNQLGNPFPYPVRAAQFRVLKRDSLLPLGTGFTTPISATPYVWSPDSSRYDTMSVIPAGAAFWVRLADRDTSHRWTIWPIGSNGFLGAQQYDLALGPDQEPRIVYRDAVVRYTRRSGHRWIEDSPAASVGSCVSMAVHGNGYVSVAYDSARYVRYRLWRNGTWDPREDVDNFYIHAVDRTSIAVDGSGNPYIAYCGMNVATQEIDLIFAQKVTGRWIADYADTVGQTGWTPRVVVDRQGNPTIAYTYQSNTGASWAQMFAYRVGGTWRTETVDGSAGDCGLGSLAFDSSNRAHILYSTFVSSEFAGLRLAIRNGTTWSHEDVPYAGVLGAYSDIAIDSTGRVHILSTDMTNFDVVHGIRDQAGAWTFETIDQAGTLGYICRIVMKADGTPCVGYGDVSNSILRYGETTNGDVVLQIPRDSGPVPASPEKVSSPANVIAHGLRIVARQDGLSSQPVSLGSISGQGLRIEAPPESPLPSPTLVALSDAGGLAADYRGSGEPAMWQLGLRCPSVPGEVTFDFDLACAGDDFVLSDPETGWEHAITPGRSVSLPARSSMELRIALVSDSRGVPGPESGSRAAFVYPNPFRSGVGLVVSSARASEVRAEIVDVAGRRIRSISKAAVPIGETVLVWDGKDDAGRPASKGVYLIRFRCGNESGCLKAVRLD